MGLISSKTNPEKIYTYTPPWCHHDISDVQGSQDEPENLSWTFFYQSTILPKPSAPAFNKVWNIEIEIELVLRIHAYLKTRIMISRCCLPNVRHVLYHRNLMRLSWLRKIRFLTMRDTYQWTPILILILNSETLSRTPGSFIFLYFNWYMFYFRYVTTCDPISDCLQ